jgi:hypothetical protein
MAKTNQRPEMAELTEAKDRDRNSSENNPSPVVLEMELPPPSDG